jgi:hypothetical protein
MEEPPDFTAPDRLEVIPVKEALVNAQPNWVHTLEPGKYEAIDAMGRGKWMRRSSNPDETVVLELYAVILADWPCAVMRAKLRDDESKQLRPAGVVVSRLSDGDDRASISGEIRPGQGLRSFGEFSIGLDNMTLTIANRTSNPMKILHMEDPDPGDPQQPDLRNPLDFQPPIWAPPSDAVQALFQG